LQRGEISQPPQREQQLDIVLHQRVVEAFFWCIWEHPISSVPKLGMMPDSGSTVTGEGG
jgi:hypothetical protein